MAFSWPATTMGSGDELTAVPAMHPPRESREDEDGLVQGPRRLLQRPSRFEVGRRWGAHNIYERVWHWHGTSFPDQPQETAALAYDVANFPAARRACRGHLAFVLAARSPQSELRRGARAPPPPAWARVPLFEKTVTASDVGKVNRLVVPKKHAERHLPPLRAAEKAAGGGVVLSFGDSEGKVWRFQYSYQNSSQSYAFTKGWIRFVREKGLRAGDTVAFSRWTFGPDEQLLIDCRKKKKKQQQPEKEDAAGTADDLPIAVQGPVVVKLFGVDIAVGGREPGEGFVASS